MHSLWALSAWLTGIGLGLLALGSYERGLDPTAGYWFLALAALLASAAWVVRNARTWSSWGILAACVLAGCGWALQSHPPVTAADIGYYAATDAARPISLTGVVEGEPSFADTYQRIRVRAEQLRLGSTSEWLPVQGPIMVIASRYPEWTAGERVALTGKLTTPPKVDGFDYPAYVARQGIYAYMSRPSVHAAGPSNTAWWASLVAGARNGARSAIKATVAEPIGSLTVGVVIGDRTSMPPSLQDAFARSGTVHVLAVSGQNMALIVGFVWLLYTRGKRISRLPLWLTALLLVLLAAYTFFTGASASVVRAAIMSAVLILGPVLGRRYDPLAALAVSAAVMTAFDPDVLLDAGFQLSFGAMLGIAVVSPRIHKLIARPRVPSGLAAALAAGLGAQAFTFPVTVALTNSFSVVGPFATLTLDAALLPLMVFGLLTAVLYPLLPALALLPAAGAWLCGEWMALWVQFWSGLPFASVPVPPLGLGLTLAYFALISVLVLPARVHRALRVMLSTAGTAQAVGAAATVALGAAAAWLALVR